MRVPRISLDARIEAVGVEDDGTVEIPAEVFRRDGRPVPTLATRAPRTTPRTATRRTW